MKPGRHDERQLELIMRARATKAPHNPNGRAATGAIHTQGLENFWSLLKRTIEGTYVSVEPVHLGRYLDEQAFPFNEREGKGWRSLSHSFGVCLGQEADVRGTHRV